MTTTESGARPSAARRASAALALTALAAALLFLVVVSIRRWDVLLASVVSLAVAVVAAWYVLSRRGAVRAAAAALGAIALVVFIVVILASQSGRVLVVGLGLAAISVAAAGHALAPTAQVDEAEDAPKASHAVLMRPAASSFVRPTKCGPGANAIACVNSIGAGHWLQHRTRLEGRPWVS